MGLGAAFVGAGDGAVEADAVAVEVVMSLGTGFETGLVVAAGTPEPRAVPRYSPVGAATVVAFVLMGCPGARTGTLTSVFVTLGLGAVAWSSGLRLTPATALLFSGRAPFDKAWAPADAPGGLEVVAGLD